MPSKGEITADPTAWAIPIAGSGVTVKRGSFIRWMKH